MTTTLKTNTTTIVSAINDFNLAWNEKNLNRLARFLADDVIYINPTIKLGFVNITGKKLEGIFELLKFWKSLFQKFKSLPEDKVILSIEESGDNHIVTCRADNHGLELSSKLIIHFNSQLLISRIEFTEVTQYKKEAPVSLVSILAKQLRSRFFNN
jgi:ketosteroid isomerase-like protein